MPILDLTPLTSDDDGVALADLVLLTKDVMTTVGFFGVKNHGFPDAVMGPFWSNARKFFDLDDGKKQQVAMSPDYPYGYEKNVEHLASSLAADKNAKKDPKVGSLCGNLHKRTWSW